jgi:hypothetical protein
VCLSRSHSLFEEGPYLPLNTQTQERLTELSLMTTEVKILQYLENSPNFCDSVIDIFTEKNRCMEMKYEV